MNLGLINVFLPLFSFGMTVAFLGAIKLRLAQRLHLNDAQIASFVSLAPLSNVVGTLVGGYWLVGISYQLVIIGGFFSSIISTLLFSQVKTSFLLVVAVIALGLGGSWLNLGSNALLAALVPNNLASITNLAHACFGIGALILPLFLSALLRRLSWRYALGVFTIVLILLTLPALLSSYPESGGIIIKENSPNLLTNPIIELAMLASLCYVGIESSLGIWTTTYLRYLGWEELTASSLVSLFWFGLTGGRLMAGFWITSENSLAAIQGSMIVILITLTIMTLFLKRWLSIVGIITLGLACALIFPTLVGWLFSQFDPRLSGTIYALISGTGMIGSALFPFILGKISNQFSIIRAIQLLLIPGSCLLAISFAL